MLRLGIPGIVAGAGAKMHWLKHGCVRSWRCNQSRTLLALASELNLATPIWTAVSSRPEPRTRISPALPLRCASLNSLTAALGWVACGRDKPSPTRFTGSLQLSVRCKPKPGTDEGGSRRGASEVADTFSELPPQPVTTPRTNSAVIADSHAFMCNPSSCERGRAYPKPKLTCRPGSPDRLHIAVLARRFCRVRGLD